MQNPEYFPKISFGRPQPVKHPEISVTVQDGAHIYSTDFICALPAEKVRPSLRRAMETLCQTVSAANGMIGHIKGTVSEIVSVTTLSTTGFDVSEDVRHSAVSQVNLTVIVYCDADLTTEIERIRNNAALLPEAST